ncbi:proton-coupled zinc antiporter SLC30A2-like isoform X2 [Neocloeon triangulifer]|uniref:proton-coupled zinc antiporter SLC30A2-like isoform X2 n=1 Tax=Neocloeon triangulifer TaxID=2078957 RepID=UPI00286F75A8|nr:proton-coupled zinc antiporter SLC30A2-like isoform X2 [Neocloeon triangulifer]
MSSLGRINRLPQDLAARMRIENSEQPLLGVEDDDEDDLPTFCVRCRSLSGSLGEPWRTECNGHHPSPRATPQLIINAEDPDVPLLTNEGYNTTLLPPFEEYHCHSLSQKDTSSSPWKPLLAATLMCLVFMIAEVIGGYLAGSLAVMTDAAHLMSDFVGFLVSLFAIWVAKWPSNKNLQFGYHRAEILGAMSSIFIIWILTGIFVYLAVLRVINQDFVIEPDTMMIVAALGVVVNIFMGLALHGACFSSHGHSHGHHHSDDSNRNINIRAAVIHVVGDLVQSVGVFISSIVIKFYPQAKLADPICTFAFSLLVLCTTGPIVKDATRVLMEGAPRHLDYSAVLNALQSIEGVRLAHSLQMWSLSLSQTAVMVHLAVDPSVDRDHVLHMSNKLLRRKFNISMSTVQVERYQPDLMSNCVQCQPLSS